MVDWNEIRKEWETSKITLAALAEKHDIKLGTLKSRKSREGWSRGSPPKKDATKPRKDATIKQKDATPKSDVVESLVESEGLTDKQRLFCVYYVKSFNATQSAIKAGYSADTAHVQGPRLLGNVRVAEEIKRIKTEMANGVFIDAMDVLNKYIKIAFADITDYITFGQKEVPVMTMFGPMKDDDGNEITKMVNYVEFNESNTVDGTIISEVKQGKDGVGIKFADKMKALDKLAQYFDLFPDEFKRKIETERLELEKQKASGDLDKDDELIEEWIEAVTDDE